MEILGDKAKMNIAIGNILAIKGCQITEFQQTRQLTASYLTHIVVNPSPNKTLPKIERPEAGSPVRKAMKAASLTPLTIGELRAFQADFSREAVWLYEHRVGDREMMMFVFFVFTRFLVIKK